MLGVASSGRDGAVMGDRRGTLCRRPPAPRVSEGGRASAVPWPRAAAGVHRDGLVLWAERLFVLLYIFHYSLYFYRLFFIKVFLDYVHLFYITRSPL